MISKKFLDACSPRLLSVLRIVVALLYIEHGTSKFFGFPGSMGHVPLFSLIGLAGVLEIGGSVLIFFGLFTRPVAFILSGEMAFAYFIAHAPNGFFPFTNHGEQAVFYCFVFLYFAAAGGGAWSLDAWFRRSKSVTA
ncbi:MAG: DoxX family protein [Gammaproteobacteria bacterium]